MFLFALPFHSFGIGSLFTIMMSMTADVCDLDELENGVRREGVLGAVYWWMVKLGFGVAALFSGFILWLVGFDPDQVTETATCRYEVILYISSNNWGNSGNLNNERL